MAAAALVERLLGAVLLPASTAVPATPALAQEVWEVMRLLAPLTRFKLYAELRVRRRHQQPCLHLRLP